MVHGRAKLATRAVHCVCIFKRGCCIFYGDYHTRRGLLEQWCVVRCHHLHIFSVDTVAGRASPPRCQNTIQTPITVNTKSSKSTGFQNYLSFFILFCIMAALWVHTLNMLLPASFILNSPSSMRLRSSLFLAACAACASLSLADIVLPSFQPLPTPATTPSPNTTHETGTPSTTPASPSSPTLTPTATPTPGNNSEATNVSLASSSSSENDASSSVDDTTTQTPGETVTESPSQAPSVPSPSTTPKSDAVASSTLIATAVTVALSTWLL